MSAPTTGWVNSLYVHVPFCAHKCLYCAFYSEVPGQGEMDRYTNALLKELELAAPLLKPRTIFFGGGTPSLLGMNHWQLILKRLEQLDFLTAEEFTIECNPATVDADKARLWRDYGVNRISLGIQSLDDTFLSRLGRIHTRAQALESYDLFRKAGFENINLDLMFAIPGQTLEMWKATLAETLSLGSEHLSSYEVTYEEDTPLYEQLQAGQFDVNEDLACDMYDLLVDKAGAAGVMRYEISNFARNPAHTPLPSLACKHNVNYWRGGSYFGLGPSATGYVDGCRYRNITNTRQYCEAMEHGSSPIEFSETLTGLARAGELAAFGLRMTLGWPFEDFQALTGLDLREHWSKEMASLVRQGWAEMDDTGFRLTSQGLRYADRAAQEFIRLPSESGD